MSLHQFNPGSSSGAWAKNQHRQGLTPHWILREEENILQLWTLHGVLFCCLVFLIDIILLPFPLSFHHHDFIYELVTCGIFDLIITVDWIELIREKPCPSEHGGVISAELHFIVIQINLIPYTLPCQHTVPLFM